MLQEMKDLIRACLPPKKNLFTDIFVIGGTPSGDFYFKELFSTIDGFDE